MLRPITFAFVLLMLLVGTAAGGGGKGGPAPGVAVGWDGAVDASTGRSLRGTARGEDDRRRHGAHK